MARDNSCLMCRNLYLSSMGTQEIVISAPVSLCFYGRWAFTGCRGGNERLDPRTVLFIILGGGAGTRLYPLIKRRAKPAVPIGGGTYRLIDVPMSNCINNSINKVFILTQFNSTLLNRHLARTYNFGKINFGDGFVEVLAATQTPDGTEWFQGTADAVRQYLWLFEDAKNKVVEDVVILSGDHLYHMDYLDFVQVAQRFSQINTATAN